MKKVKDKLELVSFEVAYLEQPEGGYFVEVLGADGVCSEGESIEESRDNILDVIQTMYRVGQDQLFADDDYEIPPGALVEQFYLLVPQ